MIKREIARLSQIVLLVAAAFGGYYVYINFWSKIL